MPPYRWQQAQLRPQEPSWHSRLWEWGPEGLVQPLASVEEVPSVAERPPMDTERSSRQYFEGLLSKQGTGGTQGGELLSAGPSLSSPNMLSAPAWPFPQQSTYHFNFKSAQVGKDAHEA